MAEQSQSVGSIKSRIAALNLEEIHTPAPGARPNYTYEKATAKKARPPPPPSHRPSGQPRGNTVNNPPLLSNATNSTHEIGNRPRGPSPQPPKVPPALPPRLPPRQGSQTPPSLPTRTSSANGPPRLPPRKASQQSLRKRDSSESVSTIASIGSAKTSMSGTSAGGSLYQVRAPVFDPSKLPPIVSKKKAPEERKQSATLNAMRSKSSMVTHERTLPPQLPARPPLPARKTTQVQETTQSEKPRIVPPPPPTRSALDFALNKSTEPPPPIPTNRPPPAQEVQPDQPPPIPLASRPNLEAIMRSKPKPGSTASCLICRDFSGPDNHAAQYPRRNLPGSDVAWLAHQLTAPFSSPTDKARAIFFWLHDNVDYDVHSFFSGTCSGSTPERTMTTGLAVCEGYASLFAALALKAGLEAIVVGGHGKGYGYHPLKPGDPLPEFKPSGHAWNAVRIDNGEWKLIDPCWGAGHVSGESYVKSFTPAQFTMSNDEFGKRHYPSDNRYFFRNDGRPTLPWEEYWLDDVGERLTVYSCANPDHGLGERTFQPSEKHIRVHDPQAPPVIRFQFATACPHWDHERHGKGKPYVMVLNIGGRDGRNSDKVPFETDAYKRVWWVDVNRQDLGAPGQKVSVYAVTSIDNRDARGVSITDYKATKGKKAMGFAGIAMWELI